MHNKINPYVPPGAIEMEPGVILADDDMEVEEEEEEDHELVVEVDDSDDEGGNISSMDNDHEE